MPSVYYNLKGKTKWFRPDKPDKWGKFSQAFYPDQESLDIIRKLLAGTDKIKGLKNTLKKDDDGYCINMSKRSSREIKGKIIGQEPPLIFDKDGKTPLRNIFVGNGSDVTNRVCVFQYQSPGSKEKNTAWEWVSTRVDNLVPYTSPTQELTPEEQEMWKGLPEASPQKTTYFN